MTHDRDPARARLAARAADGCEESRLLLTRRNLMGLGAGLFTWGMQSRSASAATTDPRLVVVVLRGGADGLSIVVPYGDTAYASARGALAMAKSDLTVVDSFFGLHPALKTFGTMFKAGEAAAVHATCIPLRNRSHFDCQDNLESGLPGMVDSNPTGWINRLLSALPTGAPVRSHGALEIGEAPLILRGPAPVLGWSPTWFDPAWDTTVAAAQANYDVLDPAYGAVFAAGIKTDRLARKSGARSTGSAACVSPSPAPDACSRPRPARASPWSRPKAGTPMPTRAARPAASPTPSANSTPPSAISRPRWAPPSGPRRRW